MGIVQERWSNTYALSANLIKILGNHTLKFGGEWRLYDYNALPQFYQGYVNVDNSNYAFDEWANFLLGNLNNFQFQKAIRTMSFNRYAGYFVNDTWNATRKLTVNAGLRWELPGAYGEKHDRSVVALPNVDEVINGVSTHGTMALVNSSKYASRYSEPVRYNLFSPRLGLAYRLNDSTVLRAGYALTFLPPNLFLAMEPAYSPTNLAYTNPINSSNSVANYTVSNPLGTGTSGAVAINQPRGRDANFMNDYANVIKNGMPTGQVAAVVPSANFPYMQQWNFTVGQQFKGQQSLEVGYVGAIGIGLPNVGQSGWGLNQLSSTAASTLAADMTAAGTNSAAQLAAKQKAQATRPRPAYLNFVDYNPQFSTMTYHGLQSRYQKRFGSGILSSAYTWSKSIGDTDTLSPFLDGTTIGLVQNYNNSKEERSILSFNISHRWVTSYVLDLPFGKGKKWANSLNGAADRIVGGWSINGITTLQSGRPLALMQNATTLQTSFGAGTIRPKATCSKATTGSAQSRLSKWFEPSCYTASGAYELGNEARVDSKLTGPGIANWDFTAQKTTAITEKTNIQFRVEFFNIFNRRQFSNPGMNISSGTSSFGVITTQQNQPRQIQAAMRFAF
jgi:outer membrane receptor protein involved in Fe transport